MHFVTPTEAKYCWDAAAYPTMSRSKSGIPGRAFRRISSARSLKSSSGCPTRARTKRAGPGFGHRGSDQPHIETSGRCEILAWKKAAHFQLLFPLLEAISPNWSRPSGSTCPGSFGESVCFVLITKNPSATPCLPCWRAGNAKGQPGGHCRRGHFRSAASPARYCSR